MPSVDASEALAQKGVLGFITSKDVPGSNKWGVIVPDEELYVSDIVTCIGQVIGVVVATDRRIAREAAQLVKVDYEEYPAIITMKVEKYRRINMSLPPNVVLIRMLLRKNRSLRKNARFNVVI
jgi:xanthine dehydrogenase molybdopterin-binding subunit B